MVSTPMSICSRSVGCLLAVLAVFSLAPASLQALVVTELMFHPLGDNPDEGVHGEEYIELLNETTGSIDLSGYRFTRGISGANGETDYTIPNGTVLPAGQYLVVAREPAAMTARRVARVIGPYGGNLKNSGERLTLVDAAGETVVDVAYSDRGDWPAAGDGTGHSLILKDISDDPDMGRHWRLSQMKGGSPGVADVVEPQTLHLVYAPDLKSHGCATDCSRQRYFKGTVEPPATWKDVTFDDSSWLIGCGGWGYGDEDDCTLLSDMYNYYLSVYARVGFELTADQIANMTSLTLEVRYDDGFVAYLNGDSDPIDRANVNGTPPAHNQRAAFSIEPTTQTKDLTSKIGLLQAGPNVLALQGHNYPRNSSDLSLIPRLTAVIEPPSGSDDPARQLLVNEIFADGFGTEWFELYNPTDQAVALDGVWLSNSEDNLAMQALPSGTTVPAKGFLLLQQGVDYSTFSIRTTTTSGQIFLTAPSQAYVLTGYCFGTQRTGWSIGRYPDGGDDWYPMDTPSPETFNSRHRLRQVVISELMYHPLLGDDAGYVELYNTGTTMVNISGWEFDGIGYRFGDNKTLPPGGYAVVCDDRTVASAAYGLVYGTLYGNYHGNLARGGEKVVLLDENDLVVDCVTYTDEPPWPVTPDGAGASLERRCVSDSFEQPSDWVGSVVGAPTPGGPNRMSDCTVPPAPAVVINEIMQHPFADLHDDAKTEFIEIYNNSGAAVNLTHWGLGGDIQFAFPDDYSMPAGGYLVLSSDDAAGRAGEGGLYRVYTHLSDANTLGPYAPELPNGNGDVWLIGEDGRVVDAVTYSDDFPWPSLPDGYGAVEGRGYSLERRCMTAPSASLANWEASPADGATPGVANSNTTCTLPPTVAALSVTPSPVTAASTPTIAATIEPYATVAGAQVRYFVDDIEKTSETVSTAIMANGGNGTWTATLPAQVANSVVRYQIWLNTGAGYTRFSPRPAGDAYEWNAYFVDPQMSSPEPQFHLFISKVNWQLLYTNCSPGRVIGSTLNPNWDAQVPATFVADGVVYDVTVRFQGSRWNRLGGGTINFSCPSYSTTGQVQVLSWRIKFPSYRKYNKLDTIALQKQSGWPQRVSFKMFELAGVPAPITDWASLHINGCLYNEYAYLIERPAADLMQRWFGTVGDLFKSQGFTGDEGPFSWGDERLITGSLNGYTEEQRYEYTYDRTTLSWKGRPGDGKSDMVEGLIEGLNAARAQGTAALREFLTQTFDVELTLRYIATINYVGTFDDMFQNHFLYRKADDGKWCMLPWDMDNTLGGAYGEYNAHWLRGANRSDVGNRSGWWNYIKDSFFLAYEAEFTTMMLYLNNEVYPPEVMNSIVEALAAERGVDPSGIKNHIQARHDWLNANVVIPICRGDPAVVDGTLSGFTVEGPDVAIVNRTTRYQAHAVKEGATVAVDVGACTTWSTSQPDIATISDGQVMIRTANPPPTLDIIATVTDATGLRTATKTVTLAIVPTTSIDLGLIVGGGDGISSDLHPYAGINMIDGQFEPTHYNGGVGDGSTLPQPVPAPPGSNFDLVDSVFILHSDVAINQAGVRWGTANWTNPIDPFGYGSWDFILNNTEPGDARPLRLRENGQTVEYTAGLGIHSSAGITFDLGAIATYANVEVLRFVGKCGVHAEAPGSVEGFVIFSDDTSVLSAQRSGAKYQYDDAYVFDVVVPAKARYLTLAIGAAADGLGSDHGVFANAFLITQPYVLNAFDFDGDRDVDQDDFDTFAACLSGPSVPRAAGCEECDSDGDGDVDQNDYGVFQRNFTGSP
ncbi:MAG TPA: lamin tail domain-containing protein [Phycisphaerae bacterium]|nr:lamin tail domain-containing protein [Phycisphaerae bacterium]HRY68629.1 lamin tail domain-containing protein [Phycisphaerae bacterium]HSA25455.1 lamin tail domain-containing protein [Phycisphaerae bacterium]